MNRRPATAAKPSPHVIDAVIDVYVAWREASAAVSAGYESWSTAVSAERDDAYAGYVAALDREELAATRYQCLVKLVAHGETDPGGQFAPVDRTA